MTRMNKRARYFVAQIVARLSMQSKWSKATFSKMEVVHAPMEFQLNDDEFQN
jgi:hypothetical protein